MSEIHLRKLTIDDTANIVRWRNQPEVYKNLYTQTLITEEIHIAYFHKYVETGLVKQFIVEADIDGVKTDIGTTFLKNIDSVSQKAEFGIFIGESKARGRGLSNSIVKATLDVAFNEMKLNKVYLTVFGNNAVAIRSYENAGFKQDGVLRQDFFDGKKYVDVVLMSVLSDEFKN